MLISSLLSSLMAKASDNNVNCTSVDGCYGCYGCYGCRGCYGCDGCDGCYYSFGLRNCKATFKSLFCTDLFGDKYKLFNKDSNESRIEEIQNRLRSFNWYPKQTNAFELYVQNGNQWSKIDTSKLGTKDWSDSWEDCPEEMVSYLRSLPEFDAKLFEAITGIKVKDDSETKQKAKELEDEAQKLLDKAKELRSSL